MCVLNHEQPLYRGCVPLLWEMVDTPLLQGYLGCPDTVVTRNEGHTPSQDPTAGRLGPPYGRCVSLLSSDPSSIVRTWSWTKHFRPVTPNTVGLMDRGGLAQDLVLTSIALQGYLTDKRTHPPRTLPKAYA